MSEPELVTIPDAGPAGQDGVQVIVDGQVASAEPVGVARGEPGHEPGHQGWLCAVTGSQFLPHPRMHQLRSEQQLAHADGVSALFA